MWQENHSQYWSNWHISLTSWIRDYVYIPLAKLNRSKGALMFWSVFILVLIGFWHGANWTFIVFGFVNGIVMLIQRLIRNTAFGKLLRSNVFTLRLQKYFNFNLLILEAVYFRSIDLNMAHKIYGKIFTEFNLNIGELLSLYKFEFVMAMGVSGLLWVTVLFNKNLKFKYNWLYVTVMLFLIIFLGQDLKNSFVYFQF
jgi:alginate O-acetyltransferase complex protein AlgI